MTQKNITQNQLNFLKEVKENNNKQWFEKNKERYLGIKKELELFAAHLFSEINTYDESLQSPGEKPYMFRIYRDARFAKGKKYKENYGILISPGGKPNMHLSAGYFLNIEPGNSFYVGGVWRPDSEFLKSIRSSIDNGSQLLRNIIQNKDFKKYFSLSGDQVKTAPKGYKKDHPDIDLLRFKDFYAIKYFTDKEVLSDNFFETLTKLSKILYPFRKYLNNQK